jgi:hypothetical protein
MNKKMQLCEARPNYIFFLNYIYRTDIASETIRSISVDGKFSYVAVSRAGYPFGVASFANKIFWTDRLSQRLKGKQLDTFVDERGIYIGRFGASSEVLINHTIDHSPHGEVKSKITIMNNEPTYEQDLLFRHECHPNKNKCSHICLLSSEQELLGTCVCPEKLKLDGDNRSCVPLQAGDTSSPALCVGGKCRVNKKKPKSSSSEEGGGSSTSTSTEDPSGGGEEEEEDKSSTTFQMFPTGDDVFPPLTPPGGAQDQEQGKSKKKKKKKKPSSSSIERGSRKQEVKKNNSYVTTFTFNFYAFFSSSSLNTMITMEVL